MWKVFQVLLSSLILMVLEKMATSILAAVLVEGDKKGK